MDADFPRSHVVYEHWFRFGSLGSLLDNDDTKLGFGLVGAPSGAANQDSFSTGGNKFADSVTERMTISRPGYIAGSDPGGLAAYIYADYAGGKAFSSYGLRFPYRKGGQAVIPSQGTWYKRTVETKINNAGQSDGVYRVWIDNVLVLELLDVRWNPAGQNVLFGYLMTQTFSNATLATAATFDQTLSIKLRAGS